MLRYVSKKFFSDRKKLEEAKKRAMKTYEEMLNHQNILKNRELEESLKNIEKQKFENPKIEIQKETIRKNNKEINKNYEKKVQEVLSNYKLVNNITEKFNFTSDSNYSKIENGTLNYRLKKTKLNNTSLENGIWLNIYENKINEKFEKLKRNLFLIIKLLFLYETYKFLKNIYEKKINMTYLQNFGIFCFYSSICIIYSINKSFNRRVVRKILFNTNSSETIKIIMQNKNMSFFETKISNLYSITSKKKNVHEIFYYNIYNKRDQLFVPKNALYDPILLMNLCHPQVKSIKFLE